MEDVAKESIAGGEDTPTMNGVNGEDERAVNAGDSPTAKESNVTDEPKSSPAKADSLVASAEAEEAELNDQSDIGHTDSEALVAQSDAKTTEEDLAPSKPEEEADGIVANTSAESAEAAPAGDDVDSHTPTLPAIAEDSQEAVAAVDDNVAAEKDCDLPAASESAESAVNASAVGAENALLSTNAEDKDDSDYGDGEEIEADVFEDDEDAGDAEDDEDAEDDVDDEDDEDAEDDEDDEGDEDDSMAVDEDNVNGGVDTNSLDNDVQHVPIVNEVHDISDSESEENDANNPNQNHSESNQPDITPHSEHMDVDGALVRENGHSSASAKEDKEDKPVSIGSDSDHDDEMPLASESTSNNGLRAFSPVATDTAAATSAPGPLSSKVAAPASTAAAPAVDDDDDEDDCMVIEDDDDVLSARPSLASNSLLLSPRRSGRSRKSIVQARDTSNFDDDIEEIPDDPLSAPPSSKRMKSSPGAASASSGMNLTIQNARSLAYDSNASSSHHQHHSGGAKKEPTLVIIDTNQLLLGANAATAASVQALQSQNISVHPVSSGSSGGSGHVYPTNLRASITPVSMATITKSSGTGGHGMHNNNSGTPNTTITKMPLPGSSSSSSISPISNNPFTSAMPAAILPALSDDMFVLEAPSFIVPYIYEKPPGDELRVIVDRIGRELAEQKKQEDIEVAENEAKEREAMTEEQRKLAELAKAADANKKKQATASKQKRGKQKSGDESWDESDTSTDDEASDTDQPARTKVLIQEADTDPLNVATVGGGVLGSAMIAGQLLDANGIKRDNYFESPLGRFFMDIGVNLVQEHVQTDLLRQQKKKMHREGDAASPSVQMAINSLTKNLEHSKTKNDIFKFETKRCEYCNFKSESALAMAHHYEAPHLNGQMYRCNFCPFEARPPYDILFHMEAMHNVKARLDKAQTYHQCPNCPFEDNGKSKLARHAAVCLKKYRPEVNLNPPLDWEPPAKIPRIKPRHGLVGTATAYQAMAAQVQRNASNAAAAAAAINMQQQRQAIAVQAQNNAAMRGRGRPQHPAPRLTDAMRANLSMLGAGHGGAGGLRNLPQLQQIQQIQQLQQQHQQQQQQQQQQQHMPLSRQQLGNMGVPSNYHLNSSGQFVQTTSPKSSKSAQQPSISITPLPRQPASAASLTAAMQMAAAQSKVAGASGSGNSCNSPGSGNNLKPGQAVSPGQKSFVICEICDGYIKDLDQLRNHMQWMHKVKIHPKMIYNRPPLNCQKCQFRFFTDQGLERHLLGSHGLVTSSMQEAANKGKDSGRCPVCGRMYQWKLLNHVSRDHNMTLKPAHLSYKCTVCTATFGMYKQFENHVYSAHSTVAKKAMDGKTKNSSSSGGGAASSSSSSAAAAAVGSSTSASTSSFASTSAGASSSKSGDSLLKPLKINDEITIIPQPATSRQSRGGGGSGGAGGSGSAGSSSNMDSHVIEIL